MSSRIPHPNRTNIQLFGFDKQIWNSSLVNVQKQTKGKEKSNEMGGEMPYLTIPSFEFPKLQILHFMLFLRGIPQKRNFLQN